MKKRNFLLSLSMLVIFLGCSKENESLKNLRISDSPTSGNTSNVVIQGGTKDGAGNYSGVDATTGYSVLDKSYKKDATGNYILDAQGNKIWDGTYTCLWYDHLLKISIVSYKVSAVNGEPASAYITSTPDVTITPITKIGNGISAFKMEYIIWNPTTTQYIYSGMALTHYDTLFRNYLTITSTGLNYPRPQAPALTTKTNGGGSSIITDYGKLIKISTGSGFAMAELSWMPTTSSGGGGCQTTMCQYCAEHPEDPNCQP